MTAITKYLWILLLLLIWISTSLQAQKRLQIEKKNSLRLLKYQIGDSFTYQTKLGGKIWYSSEIKDIDAQNKLLYLDNVILKLDQISAVKSFQNRGWSRGFAHTLRTFALSWTTFAAVDQITGGDTDWKVNAIAAGVPLTLSIPLQLLFESKTHKLNKKFSLRLLDLRME